MTRFLLRAYALALAAYPPALRRSHGAEMLQCARAAVAAVGVSALPRLFADLAVSVPREWLLCMEGVPMTGLGRDVLYALRLLRRTPGFTAAAVVTLALGIGANTAIFSLADATLLRPVKVARPADLRVVKFATAYPDYLAYTQLRDRFDDVAAYSTARVNVAADGRADLVTAAVVSGSYFGALGVPAALGRTILPSDDERNGPVVVVLGHRFWRNRFGGDPEIVGRTIRVNNVAATVVGVARDGFSGTNLTESIKLFLPVAQAPRILTGFFSRPELLTGRGIVWLGVIVRLKPGVTPQAGAAAIEGVYRQFHPVRPGTKPEPFELLRLGTRMVGDSNERTIPRFVALLAAVVGLTLLIGCANLANLQLSRTSSRRRELAVRVAVGAGGARIARQLIVESLLLSTLGGAAALAIANSALGLLARFQLPGGIEIGELGLGLSGAALAFTAAVACLTGVLFGVAPAWRAARTDVLDALRESSRSGSARSGLRSGLVAMQVAFSLVLLTGTGLFLRSLVETLRVPLGFTVEGVATASVNLGAARYDHARAQAFYENALERVHRLAGVTAASWSNLVPIRGARVFTATVDGYRPKPDEEVRFYTAAVGPEYFHAAGTRLVRGRPFTPADGLAGARVAIVNEAAVRKYWAGRDPLQGRLSDNDKEWVQVIGVAEDTKVGELDETPVPYVYLPFIRQEDGATMDAAHLFVRTTGDPERLLGPLAETLRSLDRDAPIYDVSTFGWRVRQLVMPQRIGATLFALSGGLSLLLAAIGVYGVAAAVTALRTRELGIRIALGADRAQLMALVLRQGIGPVAAGLAAGLVIATSGSRLAAAFLRGVTPRDPMTYAGVTILLALVALLATWLPARRAARVDPIRALRQD